VFCPQCGHEIGEEKITEADSSDTKLPASQITEAGVVDAPVRENPPPARTPATHASSPAGVASNVRERVEKIRHVSSVVIDQAAYDPSLRFILVAAVIFVLTLLLLILSKVIG
jgi:hypothetical protein